MTRPARPKSKNTKVAASTGERWRQAVERFHMMPPDTRNTPARPGEMAAVMLALSCWLLSHDRTDDELTLAQIAQLAGQWKGPEPDCPRSITRRLGRAALYLDEHKVITYRPGGSRGRGSASWFALPGLAEGSHVDRNSRDGERSLQSRPTIEPKSKGGPDWPPQELDDETERGARNGSKGGPEVDVWGGQSGPPPGNTPVVPRRDVSEGNTGEAKKRTPSDSGSASTDSVQARLEEWWSVVELLALNLGGPEHLDHAEELIRHLVRHECDDRYFDNLRSNLDRALRPDGKRFTVVELHDGAAQWLRSDDTPRTLAPFPRRKP